MSNKVGMYITESVTVRCSTSTPAATDGYFRLQSTTEGRVAAPRRLVVFAKLSLETISTIISVLSKL